MYINEIKYKNVTDFLELIPKRFGSLGPELITTNADFSVWADDDPTDWQVTEDGDASSNITEHANGCQMIRNPDGAILRRDILTADVFFRFEIVIDALSSDVNFVPKAGTSEGSQITIAGTHVFYLTASDAAYGDRFQIVAYNPCDVIINSVSIKQVLW